VADGSGARPESARERGCRWPKGAVRVRGAVGKLGCSREEVGEELGREDKSTRSRLSGAVVGAAERERKERGKRWGSRAWGCHTARWCHGA
jgi:hypothetical protein